jgi:hypothetical protein
MQHVRGPSEPPQAEASVHGRRESYPHQARARVLQACKIRRRKALTVLRMSIWLVRPAYIGVRSANMRVIRWQELARQARHRFRDAESVHAFRIDCAHYFTNIGIKSSRTWPRGWRIMASSIAWRRGPAAQLPDGANSAAIGSALLALFGSCVTHGSGLGIAVQNRDSCVTESTLRSAKSAASLLDQARAYLALLRSVDGGVHGAG